jgi:hypothetical protein
MTATVTPKDFDQALISPEKIFDTPMDVVKTDALTAEQKLRVLKHWENNERDLQVATEEAMIGPGEPHLGAVRRAIIVLCEQESLDENSVS